MRQLDAWLNYNRTRLSKHVNQKHIDIIKRDFINNKSYSTDTLESFITFLFDDIDNSIDRAMELTMMLQEFRKELSYVINEYDQQRIILNYAAKLNPSKIELDRDRQAFKRWFDEDALSERITSKRAWYHRHTIVALQRLESVIALLTQHKKPTQRLWSHFDFNKRFLSILQYKEEAQIQHSVLIAFIRAIKSFSIYSQPHLIDEELSRYIYTLSLSQKSSVWFVNDVIEFLAYTDLESFLIIAHKHLINHEGDDTIFIRHKIAKLLFRLLQEPDKSSYYDEVLTMIHASLLLDPSPYVRQGIVKQLSYTTHPMLEHLKEYFILKDAQKSVRALAILQVLESTSTAQRQAFEAVIFQSLSCEKDTFVLKTALYTLGKLAQKSVEEGKVDSVFIDQSMASIEVLLQGEQDVAIKRYAANQREFLWVCSQSERYAFYQELYHFVETITPSQSKALPQKFLQYERSALYRILCVISQEDFSLELQKGFWGRWSLRRSEKMGKRLWRILYELRNPSPDKREAFPHTIARIFEGTYHFPSSIMAEQAPTKVPGEPYFIPQEESSRPFLPLVDHYLSILQQPTLTIHPFKIYSSDGITTIEAPSTFWRRWRAQWKLTWHYASIAKVRNWQESSTKMPNAYVAKMKTLGFQTTFKPYVKGDRSSEKFFSHALLPVAAISFVPSEMQDSLMHYFISAYENSLPDLGIFVVGIFGLFFIRHVVLSRRIAASRKKIALSIGGWGTRGKSGTERLKAALFNALGLRVFSKTTGNEAMFLHAESFEGMREMYLFRPYDKATIWEQADAVLLAESLGVDVYLWESMGLTPSYVEVLQKRWMHDDIATITNTYPDHENLQGPAGVNIPQVMTNFIPHNSTLVTTEEVMYPILKSYASSVGTASLSTGWLQAGLIPPDILSRFPYEEHPYNIALVLMVARELDIDEDEALKAMADNIVPDLGVLKSYPPARVGTKQLHFINGMSANERFGALGNWRRMGLYERDDEKYPDQFLTTVINNRADRVSRSRVFASMIVEDIVADCHIIIGSNIAGFLSYVEEAWESYKMSLSLYDNTHDPHQKLMAYAKKFRIIRSKKHLKARLEVMLKACTMEASLYQEIVQNFLEYAVVEKLLAEYPEIRQYYQEAYQQYQEFKLLEEHVEQSKVDDDTFSEQLWQWLKRRLKPLYNYYATGNQVVQSIANHTPPGMFNTIIGMQNIKGTGLDFAYRWVVWESCFDASQKIASEDTQSVREGIEALASFSEHGPLTFALTQESIEIAKEALGAQSDYYQAQIQLIENNLAKAKEAFAKLQSSSNDEGATISWFDRLMSMVESFLDAGDAVKRRKRANIIYKDLIEKRISHQRAAKELQAITKRQKGGWFTQKFKK